MYQSDQSHSMALILQSDVLTTNVFVLSILIDLIGLLSLYCVKQFEMVFFGV